MGRKLASQARRAGTRRYQTFVGELLRAFERFTPHDAAPLLDGRAGQRCFDLLPEFSLNRLGAYFTPSRTASRLVALFSRVDSATSVVFDPACGAGDLLLPIAAMFPIRPTASETLPIWNDRMRGCDISPEFIETARLRLLLQAVNRGAKLDSSPTQLAALLTNIVVHDGLTADAYYQAASHVVMNPPFGIIKRHLAINWRSGQVSSAALFLAKAATACRAGAEIAALLPEVLRTGSSYAQWRKHIDTQLKADRAHSLGLFSNNADVDVFAQRFVVCRSKQLKTRIARTFGGTTIRTKFDIRVGAVVPHRHPLEGPLVAYLHVRNVIPWKTIRRIKERRKFGGTLFKPPFVVIRRTSRPGDARRAIASVVVGSRLVAVENHLIVATPRRGTAKLCSELMNRLRSPIIDRILDRTMRCRHLTTASVASLPWMADALVHPHKAER